MVQVAQWLSTLGLDRYARLFSEHEIDADTLRDLMDADLKEMGIPLGHRKRILKAIRSLEDQFAQAEPPVISANKPNIAAGRRGAERRHLTVLYVDMVESTRFAQRLDPEDLAGLINIFHETCNQTVDRFGGYVAKNLGDGLAAYFGWPQSHEHDAERAILAGLELIQAVQSIPTGMPDRIHVHVGVATGEVVVGDVIRMNSARVYEVFGELPNLAARLQALSPPNTILISAETHQLIHHKFVCINFGRKKFKGFQEATPVYRVVGPRTLSLNFDARRAIGLTPLVGREEQLGVLTSFWRDAAAGNGHVVMLTGEPGIGKSRLCAELRSSSVEHSFSHLGFQCAPLHTDTPLYPVMRSVAQLAGLSDDDSPEIKQRKLLNAFNEVGDALEEGLPALAPYLGIKTDAASALVSPEHQRRALHHLLTSFVFMLARRQPVLITFEDIHWADPTTAEFLDTLIANIAKNALLVIVTSRSAFASPWRSSEHVSLLALDRLTRSQSEQLVAASAANVRLSRDLIAELVERSDGNPLYIEELTAAVLGGRQKEHTPGLGARTFAKIPSTLQDSLLSRIDQLSPQARDLIQLCSVIGRRFSHEQISAIAYPIRTFDMTLTELVRSGLLLSAGQPPDIEYCFKHALLQDAAYSTILRQKRQQLHSMCARALEQHFPSVCTNEPGVVGLHHEFGGEKQAAIPYFLAAGQLALEKFALTEANTYLQKGLAFMETLPKSESRDGQEIKFRSLVGRVNIFAKGWADPSIKREYSRALELCRNLRMKKEQVSLEWALATNHLLRGELREAVIGGRRVVNLAEHVNDRDLLHVAHSALAIYLFYSGDFVGAIEQKSQAIRTYRTNSREELRKQFGTDRRLQALRAAALSNWCLGNHRLAVDLDNEQRSEAKKSGQAFEYTYALTISCIFHGLRRAADAIRSCAEEAIGIAREQGFSFLEANANNFRTLAFALAHPSPDALADCDRALEMYQSAGNRMGLSGILAVMAELCGRIDSVDRGLSYCGRAIDYVRRSGERFAISDLQRVKGELLASAGKNDDAKRHLREALQLAKEQQAKTWEIAAAIPLARILQQQGKLEHATELLRPLYDAFHGSVFVSDQLAQAGAIFSQYRARRRAKTGATSRLH